MPWTEHQQALLQAMGVRVWAPPPAPNPERNPAHVPAAASASTTAAVSTTAAPARSTAAAAAPAPAPATLTTGSTATPRPAAPRARGGIATLAWPALRAAVAGCTACSLSQSRTQTVFGTGHEQAQWMVVGEAPGEQEDQQGEPFVGPAGELLDRMLAALQLSRDEQEPPAHRVYIANTLKCRPPRNRNPSAEEMAQCEPYLGRQIELLQPRIILAMGRFAVQALLRSDEPLGQLRGRVHRYQGVPLVVTYHPAYLLRYPSEKAKAWADLCLAAAAAEGSTP